MKKPYCAPDPGCKPLESKCVLYSGSHLPNLEVFAGTNLDVILGIIDTKLGTALVNVNVLSTPSITLAGNGTLASPITSNLNVSASAGNSLTVLSDGAFVPTPPAQVNADWNAVAGPALILNKPDLSIYYLASNPAGYIDGSYVTWNNVLNKPVFATVATTGDYNDLINKPAAASTIYNSNGTLTSNRTVGGGGFSLGFDNLSFFDVTSGAGGPLTTQLTLDDLGAQISRGFSSLRIDDTSVSITGDGIPFSLSAPSGVTIAGGTINLSSNDIITPLISGPDEFLTTDGTGKIILSSIVPSVRTSLSQGTGINYDSITGVISNSAPDQLVSLTQGAGVTITGTYPNFTIAAAGTGGTVTSVGLSSSDITVGGASPITSSGAWTLTLPNVNANVGTFNNLTVNAKGQVTAASNIPYLTSFTESDPVANAKTVTLTQGTGISITGAAQTIGANPAFTITNTAPDQVVGLSSGTGISITGTYPNFTVTNTAPGVATPPAGSSNMIQYNDGGVFAATPSFTYQTSSNILRLGDGAESGNLRLGGTDASSNGTIGVVGSLQISANEINIGNTTNFEVITGGNTRFSINNSGLALFETSVQIVGNLTITGTVTASGGGFNSSRSLKEDIKQFSKSAIDIISKIPIVQFKYKTSPNNIIGFIADEVPTEVLIDGQEAMDIYSTIGILIKSIQELNDKIDGVGTLIK